QAPVVVGIGVFGVEPDRIGVLGDRAVNVALSAAGVAQIVVGIGVFRIEPNRINIVPNCVIEVAFSRERDAPIIVGDGATVCGTPEAFDNIRGCRNFLIVPRGVAG